MDLKITKSAATDVTVSVNSTEVTVQKSNNVVVEVTPQKAETITIDRGVQGAAGVGVPTGGTTGQVLAKASDTNYDTTWVTGGGGGGSGTVTSVAVTGGTTGLTTTGSPITTSGTIALGGTLALTNGGTGATTASGARTNLGLGSAATTSSTDYATAAQGVKADNAISDVTSTDGSVTVNHTGTVADLSVAVAASTTNVIVQVRNSTGATLTKGTVVYISGATGQIPTVTKALATSDATSAQSLGMMTADLANNSNGYVTIIGLINDIDTSAFTDGAQLYLSSTTAGAVTATKQYAPAHLVYVGVVEYAHAIHGKIFVKVQNGYELDELHNVSARTPSNGQTIIYDATTGLWDAANLTAGTGISVANGAGSITLTNTAPDQVVSLTGAGTTTVTGTYPSFTITSTGGGGGGGTVTSVGGTGSVNGITLTGTVTSSGNLTLGGTLGSIANSQLTNSSITINGTAVSLGGSITTPSGTVTSVTATSPVASTGGATPVISMPAATSLVAGYLTSIDWSTFNGKYSTGGALGTPASGTLTNCTGYTYANLSGTVPTWNQNTTGNAATVTNGVYTTGSYADPTWITSLAGSKISGAVASATTAGSATTATSATSATTSTNIAGGTATQIPYQTSINTTGFIAAPSTSSYLQWNGTSYTWSNPSGAGAVTSVDLSMPSGFSVSGNPITSAGTLAVTTSLSGILKGTGTGFTTATSGTDYAPATSGTSILYGNGAGGFSNVTIGSGLSFATGTLSATGGGGTPAGLNTQVQYNNSGAFGASSSFTFDGVNVTSPEFTATASTSASSNNGAFAYGALSYPDTDVMASFQSSVNSYNQVILQNTSAGASASTNFNVSNNNGTATTNYGELGINSSGFTGTGSFGGAGNVYLASASTDFAIGTYGANAIHFVTNSGATDAGSISSAGKWAINASGTNTTATALLHLGAGTATANTAPLKLTSGTNLTTAEAGAIEYDGQLKYFTPTGTSRALTQNSYYYRKNTSTVLNSTSTTAQAIFGLTSGVTVAANTIYEVEIEFGLTTTGTTSHTENIGFTLTTATVTNMGVMVNRLSTNTTSTALGTYLASVTPVAVTGALTTAQAVGYRIKGTIAFGTGGTINPTITWGTAGPTGTSTVLLGSWMKMTPVGTTGANISIGTWA